jgi:tRNA nucleotidyltransferase/poly(A) polymerase
MKLRDLLGLISSIAKKNGLSRPMICGGIVRDKYLNKLDKIEDLDITTGDKSVNFLSKDLVRLLASNFQIKAQEMNDGHISVQVGDMKVDFSSNFVLDNIDKLLKEKGIQNPTDMQRELFSRDFTCNALLMTLDLKEIIDPTNMGFKDCQDKVIKTILSPEITFGSNSKNRVVRAIYLSAKLGFEIVPEMKAWIKENPNSILISSDKALEEKLNKAMFYDPERTIRNITEMNLWNYIPITKELYPYYLNIGKSNVSS